VPDDKWGEVPVAVIVARDGATPEAAIRAACESELSPFKRPKSVIIRDEALPRTPTGKVLKRELRPWAERALGRSG